MSAIVDSIKRLQGRKKELKKQIEGVLREAARIDKAIKALEGLTDEKHVRVAKATGIKLKCKYCGEEFTAKRSDAKYCKIEHYPSFIKAQQEREKKQKKANAAAGKPKPAILLKGDALSQH